MMILINKTKDFFFTLSAKGRCAGEEDISYDTSCPYIDFVVVFRFIAQLRGHVEWTAKREGLRLIRLEVGREPEIS